MRIVKLGLFAPQRNDAAKIHFCEVANAFVRAGHDVTIVTPRGNLGEAVNEQVQVRHFGWNYTESLVNVFFLSLAQLVAFWRAVDRATDMVYIRWRLLPCLFLRFIARLKGASPLFVSEHNSWTEIEVRLQRGSRVLGRIGHYLQLMDAKSAHMTICVTEGIRQYLQDSGVKRERLMVVGNGTNVRHFRPLEKRSEIKRQLLGRDGLVLGFMGNLAKWQGLGELVDAMPDILAARPDVVLAIAGSGLYEAELKQKIEEAGIADKVVLRPNVPYEQASLWMNAFDIALAPKSKKLNAMGYSPLKIRDYAASGRPVISTRVNGIKEFEPEGWLRTFDADVPGDLRRVVLELLQDDALLTEMGEKARTYAMRHFSWDKVVERIAGGLALDVQGAASAPEMPAAPEGRRS